MSLQIKPYRIPPNSSRRNYAFPPDDCSFAGIQDPSLKSFANSLRKQPSRKVVYPGDDWTKLLKEAKQHGSIGIGSGVTGEIVSPIRRRRPRPKQSTTTYHTSKIKIQKATKSKSSKSYTRRKSSPKRSTRRKKKKDVKFSFRTSPQPVIFQYHFHIREPSHIGRSLYALGSDRSLGEEAEIDIEKETKYSGAADHDYNYINYTNSNFASPTIIQRTPATSYSAPPSSTSYTDALRRRKQQEQQEQQQQQQPPPPPSLPSQHSNPAQNILLTPYVLNNRHASSSHSIISPISSAISPIETIVRSPSIEPPPAPSTPSFASTSLPINPNETSAATSTKGETLMEHLHVIFNRIDKNGDGQLNVREMIFGLRRDDELCNLLHLPSHIHNGSSRDMFEIVFQEMDDADLRSIDFNHFSHWVVTHMNNTTDKEIFETEMNANTSNNNNHINVQQQSMVSNATTQLTDSPSRTITDESINNINLKKESEESEEIETKETKATKEKLEKETLNFVHACKEPKNKQEEELCSNHDDPVVRITSVNPPLTSMDEPSTAVLDDPRNRFDITSPSHPDYNAYILGFNKMLERSPDKLDELQSNTRSNSQKILLNQNTSLQNSPKESRYHSMFRDHNGDWDSVSDYFEHTSITRTNGRVSPRNMQTRSSGVLPTEPEF